ncbi:MAG: SDR family oxidoreductase [Cyanobacteria bacterium]|nr:SDR family oxidoreductase [Cyanobacteriota bacterium]
MGKRLNGQRVLVIGGGSQMGLAVAKACLEEGADVILVSRSAERGQEGQKLLGGSTSFEVADVSDASDAARLFPSIGSTDHVVVTASGEGSGSTIVATSPQEAQGPFKRFWINYNVLHHAPQFVKKSGSITLLSGSSGRRPVKGYGIWTTLHGSIEALAKAAALELAPIRVNVISPGGIGIQTDRQLAHHRGQPEDIAAMAFAMMINPAVTNAVIDVDGGERLGDWSQ